VSLSANPLRYRDVVNWKFFKRADPLAPCMPEVDPHPDIAGIFAQARTKLSWSRLSEEAKGGQPCVAIVSPDRTVSFAALPGFQMPQELLDRNKSVIPYTKPLNITAVSYTGLRPPGDIKQMLFVAAIFPFALLGHRIVVFEGHESGFDASLKDTDVLVIDSGMLPICEGWWWGCCSA
jgi:hypothetical protein